VPIEQLLESGITKTAETKWTVDRKLAERLFGGDPRHLKSIRVLPYERDGRVQGMKLYGVRRRNPLGRLGLRNGDIVREVAGVPLTGPDAALEAYTKARSRSTFLVEIVRRGKRLELSYQLR
jgi:type II secretory pathway component PulC